MSVFLYCGGHHDSDRTAVLVWSPRLKLLYCKYHQFMYTLPNKDFLPSFLPSFLHAMTNVSVVSAVRHTAFSPPDRGLLERVDVLERSVADRRPTPGSAAPRQHAALQSVALSASEPRRERCVTPPPHQRTAWSFDLGLGR